MWNWDWQDPADYGERYDVGIIETHPKIIKQWREHNRRMPAEAWVASILNCPRGTFSTLPERSITVEQHSRWIEQEGRAAGIEGCGETGNWELTRGGIAACWAMENAAPSGELILVGFDNIAAGVALAPDAAFSPVYQAHGGFWGMDGYKAGATKEGNHDYIAERLLLENMARRLGLGLRFAEAIWP
jgi:hypothetical protein